MIADASSIDDLDVAVIVGPMRTGTTLVAELLDSHPEVAYPGFELSEEWADWTGLPWGAPGGDDVACPPLRRSDAMRDRILAIRAGLTKRFEEHIGASPGPRPRTVVLENPHLWHRLPFLRAVLPGVRIVRTRRGRQATVASLDRLWDRAVVQHGRMHHLPLEQDHCWDFVPAADADTYQEERTFPGGDVRVLAEFVDRVERQLDRFDAEQPARIVHEVIHEDLVRAPVPASRSLQSALGLPISELRPPEPLDPGRVDEWRQLLSREERERIATW